MHSQDLWMDGPDRDQWLRKAGLADRVRGAWNLRQLAQSGMTADLYASLLWQLERELGSVSDPDMALNNLERFFAASRSPLALAALFDREPTGIPILLKLFSASQYLADLLVRDTEAYDFLRMTEGLPHLPDVLLDDLSSELRSAQDLAQAMAVIRRFKHRETLRIAFGDLIAEQRLPVVAEQISFVADAICEGAGQFCDRFLERKFGWPLNETGVRIPFAILAMGKLGGSELNYSSDIDLVMVFGEQGSCALARSRSAQEYYEELTRIFLRLVGENTPLGFAYRVDLRLRPDGKKGRLCNTLDSLLSYYELHGRPWERQALLKARPVAGDQEFGQRILQRLEPWVYSRHLNRFEIGEVKSLKRQIEKRALVEGVERRDIKTGHGGIRDIEFTIQFLQLLNGGGSPAVRTQNTLRAIERLQQAGILTLQEESLLAQNYIWLRKLEHRLQIMFDLQTHTLPEGDAELMKVARRMGYLEHQGRTPLEHFRSDLAEITAVNRRILDHLLHAAFADETETSVPPVVDLLFAPQPNPAELESLLRPFGFRQAKVAYDQLLAMAEEDSPFLPSSRCKHFLAAILPRLLKELGQTPQPDATLVSLRSVADALGAKGVLWELFQLQPNALALFVRLCAGADYLVGILRNNPGMVDELVDSLLMQGLPERRWLGLHLDELLGGADQLEPIIHSFRQAQQLRVGVQDLLGWASVGEVTQALTAIADTCLERVARDSYRRLCERYGTPNLETPRRPAGYAILACGKQGGRELNYHSDLDLIFLYEGEGETEHSDPDRRTSNQHFFSLWASEVTKFITQAGPSGRLYEIDARLRPTGKSGALAISGEGLRRYFASGQGQAWERLALCKSRVVVAQGPAEGNWEQLVAEAIAAVEWAPGVVEEIWQMRLRMQESAPKWSLKRAAGGTVDVEFLVQLFLLKRIGEKPQVRTPSTIAGLRLLAEQGFLESEDAEQLQRSYQLLRSVETALRLSTEVPHMELSEQPEFLRKLTYLMRRPSPAELLGEIDAARLSNRRLLEEYLGRLQD